MRQRRGQFVSNAMALQQCVARLDSESVPGGTQFGQVIIYIDVVGVGPEVSLIGELRGVQRAPVFRKLAGTGGAQPKRLRRLRVKSRQPKVEQHAIERYLDSVGFLPGKV